MRPYSPGGCARVAALQSSQCSFAATLAALPGPDLEKKGVKQKLHPVSVAGAPRLLARGLAIPAARAAFGRQRFVARLRGAPLARDLGAARRMPRLTDTFSAPRHAQGSHGLNGSWRKGSSCAGVGGSASTCLLRSKPAGSSTEEFPRDGRAASVVHNVGKSCCKFR